MVVIYLLLIHLQMIEMYYSVFFMAFSGIYCAKSNLILSSEFLVNFLK